jgi:hypothetical protein
MLTENYSKTIILKSCQNRPWKVKEYYIFCVLENTIANESMWKEVTTSHLFIFCKGAVDLSMPFVTIYNGIISNYLLWTYGHRFLVLGEVLKNLLKSLLLNGLFL